MDHGKENGMSTLEKTIKTSCSLIFLNSSTEISYPFLLRTISRSTLVSINSFIPFPHPFLSLFRKIREQEVLACITASSVTDLFYIIRKETHDTERTYVIMENIFCLVTVLSNTYDIPQNIIQRFLTSGHFLRLL